MVGTFDYFFYWARGSRKYQCNLCTYQEDSERKVGVIRRIGEWRLPADEEGDGTNPENGAEAAKEIA